VVSSPVEQWRFTDDKRISASNMSVMSILSSMEQRPIAIAPKRDLATHDDWTNDSAKNGEEASASPCMPYTCLTCARRKVKCDKTSPTCSTCRKARLDCTYQEPAPRKRKRKPVEDVHERLEQYEKILKANGLLPGSGSSKSPNSEEPNSNWPLWLSPSQTPKNNSNPGKLIGKEDKARYIGSTVFKNLGDDLEPSSDEDDDGDEAVQATPQLRASDPLSLAFLSPGSSSVSLLNCHPTYETAMKLWRLYVDNVDPVVKAVHVPTMQNILQRAAAQPSRVPKATEALVFSIYHFAVISITDEESIKIFGEARTSLLAKFEAALRQALVNAQWLRSTNLAVVQAFELFLLSVRSTYDPQSFWILTGVAVRMAQRLGLHRDGNELGLKPFDTQMRRRIFWQLLPLDGLAGQLSGTGICITLDSWTTEPPLNLNDTDIWPDMTQTPEPHTGATDMIFCLARTEMAKIVRTAFSEKGVNEDTAKAITVGEGDESTFQLKDRHLTSLEDAMESKYLRYCDFANPVHMLTMAMARSGINGGRLRIRLPRAKSATDLPEADRKDIWEIANKVLDYHISANSNPHLSRFYWHIKAFFQSEALAWILNELRKDPARYTDENVWAKIETTYSNHMDLAEQKRSLHMAVGRLTLKAWDATQAFRQHNNLPPMPVPAYITNIRSRPHRKDSSIPGASSSNPTPHSLNQKTPSQYQYNPFNPGESPDDLPGPTNVPGMYNAGASGVPTTGASYSFSDLQGNAPLVNNFDFEFNQMVDPNTGSIDWTFWDQLMREPSAVPPSYGFGVG